MYRYSNGQISLSDFKQPVGMNLKENNRWVKKAQTIPWLEIEKRYAALFTNRKGNVAKPLRLALGACIIQAEYGFSDEETALMIQENPYLQYFCGYPGYDDSKLPFDPSLMVYFRKRLTPEVLEWTARTMMDAQDWKATRAAASVLERRQVDPAWTQTAATLLGQAHERLGESDAAKEAYARALATGSETECGAQAALALGRLESAGGQFDEAREHLENAVTRAQSQDQLPLRIQAYAALAANEEERGEMDKALGYHMLVGSLFNEERQVAHALSRAAAILREKGREKEAADVMADLRKRFPNAPEAQ